MYDIAAVLEIISSISSTLALDQILADFTSKTAQIIGADGCAISAWDRDQDTITLLVEYVSPQVATSADHSQRQIGVAYPLLTYPAAHWVLQKKSLFIYYADDPATNPAERDWLRRFGWAGVLLIPMLYKGQAIGLLELHTTDKNRYQFARDDIPLCQALANQAAVAIENARLYQEAEEGQLHAEAMYVIGQALASELDYDRNVRNVADFAYRLAGADLVCVVVPEAEELRLVATAGQPQTSRSAVDPIKQVSTLLAQTHTLFEQVIQDQNPLLIADIQHDTTTPPAWRKTLTKAGWRALLAVPLLAHNRTLGVLAAYARRPNVFHYQDVGIMMSLASQAAVAIQNAQLFAEREAQREALRQLSLRLVKAQEEERRRISREIHDELGQALTALKINLDVSRRTLPADASAKLSDSLNEASMLVAYTLEKARNLSLELHPAILDDLGLISALQWEIDRYEQRTGQVVYVELNLTGVTLRPELEITIYRVIMEALTNIARHAQAGRVSLYLGLEQGQLVAAVEDDGVGFDPARLLKAQPQRRSLGLVSMRERTELLGGQFEVISKRGQGTKIKVRFPLSAVEP